MHLRKCPVCTCVQDFGLFFELDVRDMERMYMAW